MILSCTHGHACFHIHNLLKWRSLTLCYLSIDFSVVLQYSFIDCSLTPLLFTKLFYSLLFAAKHLVAMYIICGVLKLELLIKSWLLHAHTSCVLLLTLTAHASPLCFPSSIKG